MKKLIVLTMLLGFSNAYAADTISGSYSGFVSSTWNRVNGADCGLNVDLSRGYFSVGAGNATDPLGGFAFSTNSPEVAKLASPNATVVLSGNPDGFKASLELKTDSEGRITSYKSYANHSEVLCIGLQK